MDEQSNTTPAASGLPTELIGNLLSNPALLQKLASVVGNLGQSTNPAPKEQNTPEEESTSPPSLPAMASGGLPSPDRLSALLSNPEMLEKLPQMLSVMKPMLAGLSQPKPSTPSHKQDPQTCRDNLLLSLKPFLSPERREAVDTILRISRLGTVLGQLK